LSGDRVRALAALRDFVLGLDRFGSKAAFDDIRGMSGSRTTSGPTRGTALSLRRANSGFEQSQQKRSLLDHLVGFRSLSALRDRCILAGRWWPVRTWL